MMKIRCIRKYDYCDGPDFINHGLRNRNIIPWPAFPYDDPIVKRKLTSQELFWKYLVRPILNVFPAETAHHITLFSLTWMPTWFLRWFCR